MGKAAILIVSAFVIMGSYLSLDVQNGVAEVDRRLAGHQFEMLARNAALAGYEQARQAVGESFSPTTFSGRYEGIPYETTIAVAGSKATLTSVGTAVDAAGNPVPFHVEAVVEQAVTVEPASEPPPFMQYALFSEGDLDLGGNIISELYVTGDEANTLNANMHTNGFLSISGNSVTVQGFGTYVTGATAKPSKALDNSFDPNYNPTDAPDAAQIDRIELPAFDMGAFLSKVSVDRTTTSATLSGDEDFGGTREDPFVWHVQGNLTTSGGAELDGYNVFLVEGDVTFNGNLEAGDSGHDGGQESSIAIYAAGDVELGGNTRLHGQIVTGGTMHFMHGTPRVYGSITAFGAADLRGTPKIYYKPASPALTTIFQDGTASLRLASYTEW